MSSYTLPIFSPSDKKFFSSDISENIKMFGEIYHSYTNSKNILQKNFIVKDCKHDNFIQYYVVKKLSKSNLDQYEYAKQYAEYYMKVFVSFYPDPENLKKSIGIFYGLEYTIGIEIWNKINNLSPSDISVIILNYEKGIELLLNNLMVLQMIEPFEKKELETYSDNLKKYI